MSFFTAIPEGQAIIHGNGVYRQVPIVERGGVIYAKSGAGYVRLNQGGATSAINIRWAEIETPRGKWSEKPGGYVEYRADAPIGVAAE